MALLAPALKGKMGSTTYYQIIMPARELVTGVRPASELDEWASLGIEELIQRQLNIKRITNDIAPYVANSKDRFFGSLIVLVWNGDVEFESLKDIKLAPPKAYRSAVDSIGFVTIDGGHLIALDGQHRLVALEKVVKHEILGPEGNFVPDDDISVIIIDHESNEKTRRIFNKVNRYAKPTSKGDNIITSEDDMLAILARWLMSKEGAPFVREGGIDDGIVDWKSNTLSDRSTKLTTISVLYDSVRRMLDANGVHQDGQQRPSDDALEEAWQIVEHNWQVILEGMEAYQEALEDPTKLPDLRSTDSDCGLLFKPATQQAFIQALMLAMDPQREGGPRLTIEEAVERANRVDWSIKADVWRQVTVNENLSINPYNEAKRRSAMVMAYMIAGDLMDDDEVKNTWHEWNKVRGHDPDEVDESETQELPPPVG